jgi:hypothetical protein
MTVTDGERLLAAVGILPLRKHRLRFLYIGLSHFNVDLGDEDGGPRLGRLGLLLAGIETRQHLAFGYRIAMVSIEINQRGTNFEPILESTRASTLRRPKIRTTISSSTNATCTVIGRFV